MNIFVGNLSFSSAEEDVKKIFSGFGAVASVVIVMDEKGKKSRGFGFIEMPDEQEAQAAITALNDKEFMGRVLKVEAGRPNPQAGADIRGKEKMYPKFKAKTQRYDTEDKSGTVAKPRFNPAFKRTGGYKGGRRTGSFMRRRAEAGIGEQVMPERRFKENPMRWRKKREQPKPWQEKQEESKPLQKRQGESVKPWHKIREEGRPWQKKQGESKPWRRTEGEPGQKSRQEAKPWQKSSVRKKQFHFKVRKKPYGHKK